MLNKHIFIYVCIAFHFISENAASVFQKKYELSSQKINSIDKAIDHCWKYRSSNPQMAIDFCDYALHYINNNNNADSLLCKILNYSGVVYLNLGNVDSAYNNFQTALHKSIATNNLIEEGYAYNNLGDYYIYNSNYLLATENVIKSYKIFDNIDYDDGIAYCLVNLSEIFIQQKKYKKALDSLSSALRIRESLNDIRKIALTKRRMISLYIEKNELDSALILLNDIIDNDIIETNPNAKAIYLDALSKIHIKRKRYKDALKYRLEALDLYKSLANKREEVKSLNLLGKIYLGLKDYNNAENILNQSNKLAGSVNKEIEIENYRLLSLVFNEKKNYEKAFFYSNKYNQLNDSVNAKINANSISDLEQVYISERNERKNQILNEKIKYDKLLRRSLFLFLSLLSLLTVYLIYEIISKRNTNKQLLASNNAKDRFFSILSHDIKGPISNIKSIADLLNGNLKEGNYKELENLTNMLQLSVDHLFQLINKLIEWSKTTSGRTQYNPSSFSISAEIEAVISMLEDEVKTKNQNLSVEKNEDHIVYADQEMVNTVLRNLVANAIKFTPEKGTIQLSSIKKYDKIQVLIEDNGMGMTKKAINRIMLKGEISTTSGTNNEKGTGLGLSLCKELIKINKGKIWIKSRPGIGSKFYFSLPVSN